MNHRVRDYRSLTHLTRLRLLHTVQVLPGRPLKEIAEAAGLHVNTAHSHLRTLEAEGHVLSSSIQTGKPGRPPVTFAPKV